MNEGSRAQRARVIGRTRVAIVVAVALALPLAAHAAGNLELVPDPTLLVGLIVLFLVLVAPINRLLFKPIFRVLDEREERIAGTRAHAERLERDAEEALARYQSSVRAVRQEAEQERRSLLESARDEALGAIGEARGQVERQIEAARGEIGASLEAARATLRGQSQELARQAASQVLGRAL